MLLEKIAKRLFGKVLQPFAGLEAELIKRVPSLGIKFDAAADCWMIHGSATIIRDCGKMQEHRWFCNRTINP
jgi:hypothetical protein